MKILLTNDDGPNSEHLWLMRDFLIRLGDVTTVIPELERSGSSQAISLRNPLRINQLIGRGKNVYTVDGNPVDCVYIALGFLFSSPPDLIVSGLNPGPNIGIDVNYSGTVGAALEGAIHDIPSFSVSYATNRNISEISQNVLNECISIIKLLYNKYKKKGIAFNINLPDIKAPKGIKFTRLGGKRYRTTVVEKKDPRGRKYYWIDGQEIGHRIYPDADDALLFDGYITITPLSINRTDTETLKRLKDMNTGTLLNEQLN